MIAWLKTWLLPKVISALQPELTKLIDNDKEKIIEILNESDGAALSKYICDEIKEALK